MELSQEDLFVPSRFEPSEEQQAIQRSHDPYLIVEAAAGAAKTTTLALRVAQALQRGAPAASVLVLTYTRPAVQAMHDKLRLVGVSAGVRAKLRIRTFEDFARELLRDHERVAVPVYERPEQLRPFVLAAIERVRRDADERGFDALEFHGSGDAIVEGYLQDFFHLKGTMLLALEGEGRRVTTALAAELGLDDAMLRVFVAYERERRGGHPDHPRFRATGDATYDLARLLTNEDEPELRTQLPASGINIVAVDEMHDINRAMFTVLRALLEANRRAGFVGVGDRDQVIHAMAGARAEFMGDAFDREIAHAKRLPLSASYRFGPKLAKAAGLVSRKPYASRAQRKTTITARRFESRDDECKAIVAAALERQGLPPKAAMSEFAVLLRHAHQSIGIENLLIEANVPYVTQGMESYLFRPEVLLVRALVAYATDDFGSIGSVSTRREAARALLLFGGGFIDVAGGRGGGDDERAQQHDLQREALAGVAENPRLLAVFFENQVMRTGSEQARTLMTAAVDVARTPSGPDVLKRFIDALQPQALAARALVSSARVRQVQDNLEGLMASAAAYDNVRDFFDALNRFEVRRAGLSASKSLVLSSIEAAKGLEYEHVVMPFLNPHEFSAGAASEVDDRNLFYVGITRAKSQLTLLWDAQQPTRFVIDADPAPQPSNRSSSSAA